MNEKSKHCSVFLKLIEILGIYTAGQLKNLPDNESKEFLSNSRRNYCEIGFSLQLQKKEQRRKTITSVACYNGVCSH